MKKRKRHSHPSTTTIPDGFVRDELDEDDSADDPDFEADELDPAEDEDDEPYDVFDERDLGIVGVRTRTSEADAQLGQILSEAALDPATSAFSDLFQRTEEAEFEVDDLDSTDEEEREQGEVDQRSDQRSDAIEVSGRAGGGSLNGEEDERDNNEEVEEGDDDGEEEGDGEYQQFLRSLLTEDNAAPSVTQGDALDDDTRGNAQPPGWAMDDDDDFDYLRESARVHDDPLEYRDDYHVSRRELVQLLSNSKGKYLRRQTRNSKPKTARGTRNTAVASSIPLPLNAPQPALGTGLVNSAPLSLPVAPHPAVGAEATPVVPAPVSSTFSTGVMPALPRRDDITVSPYVTPSYTVYTSMPPAALHQFRDQLAVHVQILTTLYANVKYKLRAHENGDETNGQGGEEEEVTVLREADMRSENLIKGLIDNRRVSMLYHQVMSTNMARLKPFSDMTVDKLGSSRVSYENNKVSVYNLPVLGLLERFLNDCASLPLSGLPNAAMQHFQSFNRLDITDALRTRRIQRQYTGSHFRPGWYMWTVADDTLLAMMIAKYGTDTVEFSKDLLPHRQNEDCLARVRYLSSRRCPDNPVKRQVMTISAPLSKDELQLVSRGLALYGGNVNDPAVWKRIQRELLPGRQWSHLQKLWGWRETRRKYKAKYRAKATQKRKTVEERAARS